MDRRPGRFCADKNRKLVRDVFDVQGLRGHRDRDGRSARPPL